MNHAIYLASRSPRRGELLRQIDVDFIALPADVDESVQPGENPDDYVIRLACEKAAACVRYVAENGLEPRPVLAADTTVFAYGEILGKPESDLHAQAMLRGMSGQQHTVYTGVAVVWENQTEHLLSTTLVEMAELSDAEIADYIASGEPQDKAGAYGIQGRAGAFIRRIEGSYTGVMGLPLYETLQLLKNIRIKPL